MPKLWCYLITNQTQEATIRKPVEYEAFVTLIQVLECWNNNFLAWCGGTPHRGRNIWKTLLCSDEPDFAQPALSALKIALVTFVSFCYAITARVRAASTAILWKLHRASVHVAAPAI